MEMALSPQLGARLAVLRDLSVKAKIIGAFACVLVATVALGLFAAQRMWSMNTQARAIGAAWFPSAKATHELSYLTSRVRLKEATYLLESSDEAREMRLREVRMLDRKVGAALSDITRLAASGDGTHLAQDLAHKWKVYRDQEADLVTQQATDPTSAYVYFTGEYKNTFDEFRAVLEQVVAANNDAGSAEIAASEQAWVSARLLIGIALLGAILLCVAAGWALIRAVSAPLGRITAAMENLAGGDLDADVPYAEQTDEIGHLAGVMTTFKNQLAAADRSKAEQTEAIISSIGHGLDRLAKGDLAHRIETKLTGPFVKLRDDFNAAMARLQDTMKNVLATTGQIATGAREISQATDDLSRRTEQQAASLEETSAALEEITVTVKNTAANTMQVNISMASAKTAAEEGGRVVETATTAMDAIAQSSKKITDIIGVIDEIAFQTNLLALNAGVEAARAGDAGRGFAVVASEVRALAQRSSGAAKEIKALIGASGAQVTDGVKHVAASGQALMHIVQQMQQINAIVHEMAQAAAQEATGIEEVNAAVNQMDQVTQQNAAMVEQSTAAARNLADETLHLQELVRFFDVGGQEQIVRKPEPRQRRAAAA